MPKNDNPISTLAVASWRARPRKVLLILLLIGGLPLSGCGSLLVGAATTGGAVAVQNRSIGDAVDSSSRTYQGDGSDIGSITPSI